MREVRLGRWLGITFEGAKQSQSEGGTADDEDGLVADEK